MSSTRHGVLVAVLAVMLSATVNIAAGDDPICFGYLGCLPMGFPWNYLLRPVPTPNPPDLTDVQFVLYTRNYPQGFLVTKLPEIAMPGSDFNAARVSFFLSHGWESSLNNTWMNDMKRSILDRVDSNVFIVSWQKGAAQINYLQAVSNTRVVGAELARLLKGLVASYNASTSRFHLVGHSLGAHVSSYAAKSVTNIARITALDPAQPAFEGYGPQVGIDSTDANFVEVIHTNSRPFFPFLGLGMMAPVGHVDFYLNGGWDQPGCSAPPIQFNMNTLYNILNATYEAVMYVGGCPHGRAVLYFTASMDKRCLMWGRKVNPVIVGLSILTGGNLAQFFKAGKCGNRTCTPVGIETVNYPARGSFFVSTTGTDPYCMLDPQTDSAMAQYRTVKDIIGI